MALLLLLAMATVCAATPKDLTGKMFTFPQETNRAHVRLTTAVQVLKSVTVCLRSFTDLRRRHVLFSLATPSAYNDLMIFKNAESDLINLYIRNQRIDFGGQNYKQNTWHSICSTWNSASGLGQLWLDGNPSSRKFGSGSSINGPILIVLGQDQDAYGAGFASNESFVGMISDVHVWDHIVSPCEIQRFSANQNFTHGNVLNWNELEFQIIDKVLIEDKSESYCSFL